MNYIWDSNTKMNQQKKKKSKDFLLLKQKGIQWCLQTL